MTGKSKPNTRFKLFENKSSLAKRYSRMLNGGNTELKGDKLGWWERISLPKDTYTDITFVITKQYEHRPDLVSFRYYSTTRLTWLILQYNNIVDIEEEFVAGKTLIIPARSRVFSKILNNNPIKEPINE